MVHYSSSSGLSHIVVDRSLPRSYSKVEDDVPLAIHLDNVLEFRVGDCGHGVGKRRRKFQREVDASLTHETEVVLFAEIRGEIERVQSVSGGIVFATDVQTFVFAEFAGSGKHAVVCSYIESVPVVGPPDPGISLVGRDGIGSRKGDYHEPLWW